MSVYKRGEPKPLETFQYEHITFFGASSLCTYKIIVDEREMFFETPLVRVDISNIEHFHMYFTLFIRTFFCMRFLTLVNLFSGCEESFLTVGSI